jgi:xanthine dehydrogenase YagS FAD-binding subunit
MLAFEYARPTTKAQAVALLSDSWDAASVLAGGTDLLSLMKDEVVAPKRLVDLKDVADMKGVSFSARTGLRIGALATLDELLAEPALKASYGALAAAAEGVLSPQLRSRGTVGGDLCQRPRCWYFRSGFGLLATGPDGKPLVPGGDNRYHAILGGGPSYFVCPSSLAPALIAFGAQIQILGPKGSREMTAARFFRAPTTAAEREHDLKPNEIVTEIRVPPAAGFTSATYEVRQKQALDWPLATASVALKLAGGSVQAARVVLGHVAPVPWTSVEAEKALAGKAVNEQTAQAAADAAVAPAKALSRNAYKIVLARTAVKRAILAAAGGAR